VRPSRRRNVPALLLSTAVVVSGCLAAPEQEAADPEDAPGSPTATSAPAQTGAPANALEIDVVIADGFVRPSGRRFELRKGQPVQLSVVSDIDDEIHIHTVDDGIEVRVRAGEPATRSFVVRDAGSFEVESHHLEKVIAILVVR
jgi:hypothetical protein